MTNKTIVIYTLENGKYHAYITGMNLFISEAETLEDCEKLVADTFQDKEELANCNLVDTADQLKIYFEDGSENLQAIQDIIKIDIVEY